MAEPDLAPIFDALEAVPARGAGRVLMVTAAAPDEGASAFARAIAEAAAARTASATLLVDLDVLRDAQHAHYARTAIDDLGPPRDGRLGGASFFRIVDREGAPMGDDAQGLVVRRTPVKNLHVTQYRQPKSLAGGRVQIATAADYWQGARQAAAFTVVDAPALARSRAALALAAQMDAIVLVVSAQNADAHASRQAKLALEARGGRVLGLVYSSADPVVTALERAFGAKI